MARKELEEHDKRFHENLLKRILNKILVGFLIILSWLPFRVMYFLSDLMYLIVKHLIRYRFKAITTNLKNSFPEKTDIEIAQIRTEFYRHFCDLVFESLKMYSMSEKQIKSRIQFKGIELFERAYRNNRSVLVFAIHHNNWEWCSYLQKELSHIALMVYNPIRGNQSMENLLLHSREKWGGKCVPVHRTARTFVKYSANGKPCLLWLAADQTPASTSRFWTVFMNQEAPFYTGPEKIAQNGNLPVIFQHVKKTGRGRYEVEFSLLFENPTDMETKNILLGYVRKAEEVIRQEPEYYLWSHRRWKHKRPEGIELTV